MRHPFYYGVYLWFLPCVSKAKVELDVLNFFIKKKKQKKKPHFQFLMPYKYAEPMSLVKALRILRKNPSLTFAKLEC